jgi:hypothetical protein
MYHSKDRGGEGALNVTRIWISLDASADDDDPVREMAEAGIQVQTREGQTSDLHGMVAVTEANHRGSMYRCQDLGG